MLENDDNQISTIFAETLPENSNVTTDLIANHRSIGESPASKFEFESIACHQQLSSSDQFNGRIVRNALSDSTNTSLPLVRPLPAPLIFSPLKDRCSSGNCSTNSDLLQFTSSLNSESLDRSCSSRSTSKTLNKRCSTISNRTNFFVDHIETKEMHNQSTHRCFPLSGLHQLQNGLWASGYGSLGKLYNWLPITRRSETVSESSAIEKCRGDDEGDIENLENEFSFRAHLQGTTRNVLISPSLPSTSTPYKLERRYKKRPMPGEKGTLGSAKKVKEGEPMDESNDDSTCENLEEGMDIDATESSPRKQDPENEDKGKLGNESEEGDISFPSALFNRSHSSSILETGENKEPEPPSHLEVKYELDIIKNPDVPSSAFACISAETLADLLKSMTEEEFSERFLLIDCRYPFEFMGGHIRGACNLFDPTEVESVFYPDSVELRAKIMKKKPIFYCEFSQKRGPSIAYELRALDRKFNFERYPAVDYPEMYLLEYGYRNFYLRFSSTQGLIEPNGYIAMNDDAHVEELKNYKYHRIRTVASVYHTLARDRFNRQRMGESNTSPMEVDLNMTTPTRRVLPRRSLVHSPESPSKFPDTFQSCYAQDRGEETPKKNPLRDEQKVTPKSRPMQDRRGSGPKRSICRRLFSDTNFKENVHTPGPSSSNSF